MRNYKYLALAFILSTGLIACGDEMPDGPVIPVELDDPTGNIETDVVVPGLDLPEIPETYADTSLAAFGFAGTIKTNAGSEITNSARFTNDGETQQISIQAAPGDPRILIYESSKAYGSAIEDVKGNTRNVFESFLMQGENSALYHAKSNTTGNDLYNFFMTIEKENKIYHVIGEAANSLEYLTEEQALHLFAVAKTLN